MEPCSLPADLKDVVAIAAGGGHSLALEADGRILAWGSGMLDSGQIPDFGQAIVPPGLSNVVAVAAGAAHSLALKADGTVVAWGRNDYGEANVPDGLQNVWSIAAGDWHSVALIGDSQPVLTTRLENPKQSTAGFSVLTKSQSGKVYRLEYKNSLADSNWTALPLVAGNGHLLTLTDPSASPSQRFYRVRRW